MNEHLNTASQKFKDINNAGPGEENQNLVQGLSALVEAIDNLDIRLQKLEEILPDIRLDAQSDVDILTNNEIAQAIADMKAAISAFAISNTNQQDKKDSE